MEGKERQEKHPKFGIQREMDNGVNNYKEKL